MKSVTQQITIEAEPRRVYEFLAEPQNLPKWAVGFCRAIRETASGNAWVAETPQGDVTVRYVTDPGLGVVDFHLSPAPGVDLVAHSRVVGNGDGSEYIFTQYQAPGMPDEVFQGQVNALGEELLVLRSIMRAQAACGR